MCYRVPEHVKEQGEQSCRVLLDTPILADNAKREEGSKRVNRGNHRPLLRVGHSFIGGRSGIARLCRSAPEHGAAGSVQCRSPRPVVRCFFPPG